MPLVYGEGALAGRHPDFRAGSRRYLRGFHGRALLQFTNTLLLVLRTKAPIVEGLLAASLDVPQLEFRALLLSVREELVCGTSLYEALSRHDGFFPSYYVDLIRAGEESGTLEKTLEELEKYLNTDQEYAIDMNGHLFYVTALLGIILFLAAFQIVFVVPQFGEIYRSLEIVHMPYLVQLNRLIPNEIILALFAGAYMGLGYLWYKRAFISVRRQGTGIVNGLVKRLPIIGFVSRNKDYHLVLSSLSMLLQCGTPIAEALTVVSTADVDSRLKKSIVRARDRVVRGESLEPAFAAERHLPRGLRALALARGTATLLPTLLWSMGEQYRIDAVRRSRIAMQIAFPMMVCGIGLLVFVIYGGLFSAVNGIAGNMVIGME